VFGSGDLSSSPLISAARRSSAWTLGMLLWMLPVRRSIGQKPEGSDMVAAGIVDVQDGLVGGEGEAVGEKIVGQQPPCQDYRKLLRLADPSAFSGKVVIGFPKQ
jgi:hypothetical protein